MQELTKAQEEYFKDSAMRKENGELWVCKHFQNSDIDEFDKEKIGTKGDFGFFGKGFYFTTDDAYGKPFGDRCYECYINMKNPLIIDDMTPYQKMELVEYLAEHHPDYGKPGGPTPIMTDDFDFSYEGEVLEAFDFHKENLMGGAFREYSVQIAEYAQSKGYDGILSDNPNKDMMLEIVVFEPNQIKLTNNLYPTKSNLFKDNSEDYIKENIGKLSTEEHIKIAKYVSEKKNAIKKADRMNKTKDEHGGKGAI